MFGKKKKKKNEHAKKMVKEIRKFALEKVPEILEEIETEKEYWTECRLPLNVMLIECLTGSEFKKPKKKDGECTIDFKHKLPGDKQVAELSRIIDEFVKKVEDPFLAELVSEEDEDIKIPARDKGDYNVPKIEKINPKKLRNYIFGYHGKKAISKSKISAADIPAIAVLGKDVRKHIKRNRMLLIGGIALIIIGGAATAMFVTNMKKKDNEDLLNDISDEDLAALDDISDDDINELDDIPSVNLDEAN